MCKPMKTTDQPAIDNQLGTWALLVALIPERTSIRRKLAFKSEIQDDD